jgi:hypothetical protein
MSAVTDALFGGASRDAAGQQVDALNQAMATQQQAAQQARLDMYPRFDEAMTARQQGYQQAINQISGAMPQQAAAIQQGNVAAQQQLLSGAQQAQAAILGGDINYGAFAPQQLTYDADVFRTPDQPPTPNIGVPGPTPTPTTPTPTPTPGGGTYTGPIDTAPIGGGDNFWSNNPNIPGGGVYEPPITVPDPGAPPVQDFRGIPTQGQFNDALVNYLSGLGFSVDGQSQPAMADAQQVAQNYKQNPISSADVKEFGYVRRDDPKQQVATQSPTLNPLDTPALSSNRVYMGADADKKFETLKKGETVNQFMARMGNRASSLNANSIYESFRNRGIF